MSTAPVSPVTAVVVVGTRPEAIKMLPLIGALRDSAWAHPVVISTGQHAHMVAEVLAIDGIAPDVTFALPAERGLTTLFAGVMEQFDAFLAERFGPALRPDDAPYAQGYPAACFVHGDTSSAAAAALAAFHRHLPVVHVEAGLRTSNTLSPFPEELNRQLISRIAALHLAPTTRNKANLVREGIDFDRVFVTGNTAIDALQIAARSRVPYEHDALRALDEQFADAPVVVVTAHRRENWGAPMDRIADAVEILAERYPRVRFVIALHPNPALAEVWRRRLSGVENAVLLPALSYSSFARLLARASLAISDSGGVQEEAPSLGTPVLCVRESTERQEGVDAGTVQLVGTETVDIVAAAVPLLDDPALLARRANRPNPYGDGHAARRILEALRYIVFDTTPPVPLGPGFDRAAVLRAGGSSDPAEEGWIDSWTDMLLAESP